MADDENNGLVLKLIICLIAAASAAVVVTVYHCVTARYARPQPTPSRRWLPPLEVQQHEMSVSLEHSVAELLPAHKHSKGAGSDRVDDSMCAICLCKFEEGEELRTLPECSHSFHVACIDMWLCSHWNCPICRSAVGVFGSAAPRLMHLLNPSSITQNTSPIETL